MDRCKNSSAIDTLKGVSRKVLENRQIEFLNKYVSLIAVM